MNKNIGVVGALGLSLLGSMPQVVMGAPMIYTGVVVTDVRIGNRPLHNATVTIRFTGDTADIVQVPLNPPTSCFQYLPKGAATVSFEYRGRTQSARIEEGQLFVALDACNGGIGFGSFIGVNGLEPIYPLAFELGTAEFAAYAGLTSVVSATGDAWSCIGGYPSPNNTPTCASPDPYPIHSDIGDLFFYLPYTDIVTSTGTISSNHNGSYNRGTFSIRAGKD